MEVLVKYFDKKLKDEYSVKYATEGSAGIDLRACINETLEIEPHAEYSIPLGIGLQPKNENDNYVAYLMPRSSLGRKGLRLLNTIGVIDKDYQNQIIAMITNGSDKTLVIEPYDRICQLILQPYYHVSLQEVDDFDNVTERGLGGFGSTGSK